MVDDFDPKAEPATAGKGKGRGGNGPPSKFFHAGADRKGKRPRRRRAAAVPLGLLGAVLLIAGVLARGNVLFLKTIPATVTTVRDERVLQAVVLRKETVVTAPRAGAYVPLAKEESRVRTGEAVGLLVDDSAQQAVPAPTPGIVRFHWDGWEAVLSEETVWRWTPAEWRERESEKTRPAGTTPDGRFVAPGSPLVRLVDSHGVKLYADMPPGAAWRPGDAVPLTMPGVVDGPVRAKVVATGRTSGSGKDVVMLELDRYIPMMDAIRHVEAVVVLSIREGVVAPADAVVWQDDGPGVVVVQGGRVAFQAVDVLGHWGDDVVLGGVPPDARIVLNPERASGW